jgi:hypothetical protein
MVTDELREKIIGKLDTLTQEQAESVLRYIEVMTTYELPPDYDPDKDPIVGMFSASPHLGSKTKEILHGEFGLNLLPADE